MINEDKRGAPQNSFYNNIIHRTGEKRKNLDNRSKIKSLNNIKDMVKKEEYENYHLKGEDNKEQNINLIITDGEKFEIIKKIGEGTYGKVYLGRLKNEKKEFALKLALISKGKPDLPVTTIREIRILKLLSHQNIVKLIGVIQKRETFYLVLEYVKHNLSNIIKKLGGKLRIEEAKYFMIQLLEGISYLHQNGIIHRDIKTSNILVNEAGILKITDFGLSFILKFGNENLSNRVFIPLQRPPELLLGSTKYGTEVDIWGVGVLFLEWVTERRLIKGEDEITVLKRIYSLCGKPSIETPTLLKCPWKIFLDFPEVKQLKPLDEQLREKVPKLSRLGCSFLSKLLSLEPKNRISAKEALMHPFLSEEPMPSKWFEIERSFLYN